MPTVKTWSTPVKNENLSSLPCNICAGKKFNPLLFCEGFVYVKCSLCGLVQINPQPNSKEVENRYSVLHGNEYFSYELENEDAFLSLQKLALSDAGFEKIERRLFKKVKAPSVLDLGCATGSLLAFLKKRGWKTTGVEISPSAEYAKKRGLDIHCRQFADCRFPDESFDLVHASHFLEHINDPRGIIRESWRVLRPGGFLLMTTPNISSFQAWFFGGKWRSAIFDHLYLFSKGTIKKLLKTEGFKIEGIYTWGGLACGTAPLPIKFIADKAVKVLGLGDVMIIKAMK